MKTTIFFISSLSLCLVSVNSLITNYAVRKHSQVIKNLTSQVDSLQARLPPVSVHIDGFEPEGIINVVATTTANEDAYLYIGDYKVIGNGVVPTKVYKDQILFSRKELCDGLGGFYNTAFNTTYEETVGNFKGLQKEKPTYECSRVEPIYLVN